MLVLSTWRVAADLAVASTRTIGRAIERILRGEIDYVVYHLGQLVECLRISFSFGDFTNDGNNVVSDKILPC